MTTPDKPPHLRPLQRLLIINGGLVLLLGCVAGFGFLFYLIGAIELWPIPGKIDIQLPGTDKAWRMSHLEGVLNGFLLWLFAAVLPALALPSKSARRVVFLLIITAWLFPIASLFDAFFEESRGLRFGGPVTNMIPFFMFYVGVLSVMWAAAEVVVMAWKKRE